MPFQTTEEARAAALKSWANRPPRPAPVDGRRRSFPAGSDEERLMELRAAEIGLQRGAGESPRAWRRRLFRLAADEAAQISTLSTAAADTDDLLITHLEAEVVRLRARAARDRQIAAEHDRQADDAETALVAALRRQERA
ncbi:hypothetical protein MIC448_320017 [Microbacterium sp. C448]|nr:hypothetical protein MIC448_320017 [Microbacterium sp. C448]